MGLAPIHALGFEALIVRYFPGIRVVTVHDAVADKSWQQSSCFVVSAGALASFPGFFMPRLSRLVLLTTSVSMLPEGGLPSVSPYASAHELRQTITSLIENAGRELPVAMSADYAAAPPAPSVALTDRELDVVRLTAKGASSKEIAAALGISVNTVLTHRKKITDKLGIHGAPALVYYALTHRLV